MTTVTIAILLILDRHPIHRVFNVVFLACMRWHRSSWVGSRHAAQHVRDLRDDRS